MKKKLVFLFSVLLLTSAANARGLSRMAQRVINKSYELQSTVDNFQHGSGTSMQVRMKIDEIKRVLERMERRLGHQPPMQPVISGTCYMQILPGFGGGRPGRPGRPGGHHRQRKQISCSIYGMGATGFEIEANGMITSTGVLSPQLGSQSFVSAVRGRHATSFNVFVRTIRGQRVFITTVY